MAVQKTKKSKMRTKIKNRANSKVYIPAISKCAECKAYKLPHFICNNCGIYKGKLLKKVSK